MQNSDLHIKQIYGHFLLLSVNWSNYVSKSLPPKEIKKYIFELILYISIFFSKIGSVKFIDTITINMDAALLSEMIPFGTSVVIFLLGFG